MSLAGGPREPPVLGFARHHCSRREAWVLIPYPSPLCSHLSSSLILSPAYLSRPGAILSRPGTGWGCPWTGPVLGAREGRKHSPFLHLPSSCLGTWRSPSRLFSPNLSFFSSPPFLLSVTLTAFISLAIVSPSLYYLLAVLFFLLHLFSCASSFTSSSFPRSLPHPYLLQHCISNRPRATLSAFAERLYATP